MITHRTGVKDAERKPVSVAREQIEECPAVVVTKDILPILTPIQDVETGLVGTLDAPRESGHGSTPLVASMLHDLLRYMIRIAYLMGHYLFLGLHHFAPNPRDCVEV